MKSVKIYKSEAGAEYHLTLGDKFTGSVYCYVKGGIAYVTMEVTPKVNVSNDDIIVSGLPKALVLTYTSLGTTDGNNYSAYMYNTELTIYHPNYTTPNRIDASFCYIVG